MEGIQERLKALRQEIDDCAMTAFKAGKRGDDKVELLAVSKFHPLEAIKEAMAAGQVLFGENRVQEAKEKFTSLPEATLHIIGTLQRNKVKAACKIASCIESVDRIEVLEDIQKYSATLGKVMDVYLEVHTGEESKAGFLPDGDELRRAVEYATSSSAIHLTGLMTMAPATEDKERVRASFRTLRELSEGLSHSYGLAPLKLSMGMSGDFKIAIEEGSTLVRIGTAIFGSRQ